MPFKSQAQRRKFYAMADRGEISKSKVEEWEAATPKGKKLPERVKRASASFSAFVDEMTKIAELGRIAAMLLRHEALPPVTDAIKNVEGEIDERWKRFSTENPLLQ